MYNIYISQYITRARVRARHYFKIQHAMEISEGNLYPSESRGYYIRASLALENARALGHKSSVERANTLHIGIYYSIYTERCSRRTLHSEVDEVFAASVIVVGGASVNSGVLSVAQSNGQLRFEPVVRLDLANAQSMDVRVEAIVVVSPLDVYRIVSDDRTVQHYRLASTNRHVLALKFKSRRLCKQTTLRCSLDIYIYIHIAREER